MTLHEVRDYLNRLHEVGERTGEFVRDDPANGRRAFLSRRATLVIHGPEGDRMVTKTADGWRPVPVPVPVPEDKKPAAGKNKN
jgi:hypothetical protein